MPYEVRNTRYTTLDRAMTFTFDFVQLSDDTWRVYITDQPPYGPRATSSMATHRLSDSRGRYICWDRALRTLDDAKGVARAWADATQVYVASGSFPAPGVRHDVPDLSSSAHLPWSGTPGPAPVGPGAAATPHARSHVDPPPSPFARLAGARRFLHDRRNR